MTVKRQADLLSTLRCNPSRSGSSSGTTRFGSMIPATSTISRRWTFVFWDGMRQERGRGAINVRRHLPKLRSRIVRSLRCVGAWLDGVSLIGAYATKFMCSTMAPSTIWTTACMRGRWTRSWVTRNVEVSRSAASLRMSSMMLAPRS